MKAAILGAGALGSVIGGLMALAGNDIELWDLNDEHIEAINKSGLRLEGPKGELIVPVKAMRPEASEKTPELIILLTKTIHTETALKGVQRHIDAGAHFLTMQNGLGNAEKLSEFVPKDKVLYGCTMMPGRLIAPGHVASQGNGKTVFKALTQNGRDFAEKTAFASDLFTLQYCQETDQVIWQKAAFNCALNTICALTNARVGELDTSATIAMAITISAEVLNVAKAVGVSTDHQAVTTQIEHAIAHHTLHKPSMLQDIEAGRQTEIDSLCGYVGQVAKANEVATPLNNMLLELIKLKTEVAQNRDSS